MVKHIFNTTIVKLINAVVTFVILLINARMLGPENLGTIGLLLLAVTIILMLNNLVGGSALIFLIPRFSLRKIVAFAYSWCLLVALSGGLLIMLFQIEPIQYHLHITLLSMLLGIGFVNQNILIGKQKILAMNLITFIQYMVLISALIVIFYGLERPGIKGYLTAMYIAYSVQLLVGTVVVLRLIQRHTVKATDGLFRALVRYGFFVQLAMLAQFFNYRLTYYFVEGYLGRASLGIFEIGNKLADGLWLFPKSVSLVQYSVIANAAEDRDVSLITLRLLRVTVLLASLIVAVMVILPESFYLYLFGDQYHGIHTVIRCLAPGMVFMTGSMILAHHFAGLGKHHINTIGSLIGLVSIALLCWLLVPLYGLPGAASAASITYGISLLYHLLVFIRFTGVRGVDFLFIREDLRFLKHFLLSLRRGNHPLN
jgi:O-antigen/teichoic acid export membrane protein